MGRNVDKHMAYFDLLESIRKAKVCALCEMRIRDVNKYIEDLLYENVNDSGIRAELVKARGFCRRHAEMLLNHKDGLGTAILYDDQLKLALHFLEQLSGLKGNFIHGTASEAWKRHKTCPVCEYELKTHRLRIGLLSNAINEPEIREALDNGPGFCLPHLLEVLDMEKDSAVRRYLIDLHHRKISEMLSAVQEFIRANNYCSQGEGSGKEKDAWLRAVKMLVGLS